MAARPRLPNNVIWSLEDAEALMITIWEEVAKASERAEKLEDARLLAPLNRVSAALAGVEHHLRNARAMRYEPRKGS